VDSKQDQACLLRVVPCIHHLLQDENVNVKKKVILSFSSIYRCALLVSQDLSLILTSLAFFY
jgi:vesicle coat complex subunit